MPVGVADRARVRVGRDSDVLSFAPGWDTKHNNAVDAGVELFQAVACKLGDICAKHLVRCTWCAYHPSWG